MNVIAIDPATKSIGVYVVGEKSYIAETITITENGRPAILARIYQEILDFLEKVKDMRIDFAIIEGYPFSKHSSSMTKLAEAGGVIRLAVTHRRIPIIEIQPSQWRSKVQEGDLVLPKKGTKEKDARYIKAVYDWSGSQLQTTDEADAYMMAIAVSKIWNRRCMMSNADQKLREKIEEIQKNKQGDRPADELFLETERM